MSRSGPRVPEGANAARGGMGDAAAPTGYSRVDDWSEAERSEAIRRELTRLTMLLRRHFNASHTDNLVPTLSNPQDAEGARIFLDQIRDLAQTLERELRQDAATDPAAAASADLRRELLSLIDRFEDRVG